MEVRRFTLWRDLAKEKYIMSIAPQNKRIQVLKQYPFAYKVGKSFLGELKEDTVENLTKNYLVVLV